MTQHPQVDPQFQAQIPPLTPEEFAGLEERLLAEGCRDALVAWAETGILLDGHNRLALCRKHGLTYRIRGLSLPDRAAAEDWIDRNQLARRNLSPDAASLIRGRIYNRTKQGHGGARYQSDTLNRTREGVAAQTGVSPATIARDGRFAEAVDALRGAVPDIDRRVQAGDIPSRQAVLDAADEPERAEEILARPHVAHNSGNNEWYTPAEYIEAARSCMGGIDLDPASCETANATVQSTHYYTAEQDGRKLPWAGRVWLNPPYAQPLIGEFVDCLLCARVSGAVKQACVLTNNATETAWGVALLAHCSAVCFLRGRVRFDGPSGKGTGAPLQGQMIVYFGGHVGAFYRHFAPLGNVLVPSP
jgi:ParB family chromosome partitioning protein